jgi:hypothetical protein
VNVTSDLARIDIALYHVEDVGRGAGANRSGEMAKFTAASDVTSPRRRWSLIQILDDPKQPVSCVLALGRWDNHPVLAMRWNGDAENPIGNPQSRGLPTWFIVPDRYFGPLIATLPREMQTLARNFLPEAG